MKILVTGSHGLVGSALVKLLKEKGHNILRLVRHQKNSKAGEIYWNPEAGSIDKGALEGLGIEAVVHLAGENIAGGRWCAERKKRIRDSRVKGTRILAEALAHLQNPPKVFISASAVGFFGSRGDEALTEDSSAGKSFLAEVCREWEEATQVAMQKGIRVVNLRFGVILSRDGGALKKMLLPFKLGAGGVIGSGKQYFSWISLDDAVHVIEFALQNEKLKGPVNTVAPEAVTNREFTKTLGRVLWRPTLFPLPASTARLAFGEMADEMLLASLRVKPVKLEQAGFRFEYPELRGALKHLL